MSEFLERAHPWAVTLVLHNWPVMLYSLVAVLAATRAYIRPHRYTLLFLYGTVLLIIAYEYEKHGRATILDTTSYLFSLEVNPDARSVVQLLLLDVVPVLLRVLGFALIGGSIILRELQARRRSRVARSVVYEL